MLDSIFRCFDVFTGKKVSESRKKNETEHKQFKATLQKLKPEDKALSDIAQIMRQGQ